MHFQFLETYGSSAMNGIEMRTSVFQILPCDSFESHFR